MNQIDYFEFEDKDKDFPVYDDNPPISVKGWILLFLAFLLGLVFILESSADAGIKACIVLIIPVLYLLNWDYGLIFQKPKNKDILLALGLFVGYILYSVTIVLSPASKESATGRTSYFHVFAPTNIFIDGRRIY